MEKITRFIITWVCYFFAYVSMILGAGATLGGIIYPIASLFMDTDLCIGARISEGIWLGFRYAAVWAGGLSIVLCFMQGYRTQKGCPKRS